MHHIFRNPSSSCISEHCCTLSLHEGDFLGLAFHHSSNGVPNKEELVIMQVVCRDLFRFINWCQFRMDVAGSCLKYWIHTGMEMEVGTDKPRKYHRITVAWSSATSYVTSRNVVHSIECNKRVSDSWGGGCRLITFVKNRRGKWSRLFPAIPSHPELPPCWVLTSAQNHQPQHLANVGVDAFCIAESVWWLANTVCPR